MKRREFFGKSVLTAGGMGFLLPNLQGNHDFISDEYLGKNRKKKAKNIIFMVSDGMSSGTLTMGDLLIQKKTGKGSNWLNLYRENKVTRAVMDMASADSVITDSAAASSSWGGGFRVKNGSLNIGERGEVHLPIWQKYKQSGKKVGCVTTVPITHATPAGFCISTSSRSAKAEIAKMYSDIQFDVMMGGGEDIFAQHKNGNLLEIMKEKGFDIVTTNKEMGLLSGSKPVLGVFDKDDLPYELDRLHLPEKRDKVPSLAEMTKKAISLMKHHHDQGFCLQVEGGKVDWAAHANDTLGLLYDQMAFDEAIGVAIEFAEENKETLVIITTDHGNANPGLYYGKEADRNFESLLKAKHTTSYLLNDVKKGESISNFRDRVKEFQGYELTEDECRILLKKYEDQPETGVYNDYKLPFEMYGNIMKKHTSVAFGGTEHSADYTELAMFGPGCHNLKPFIKNVDLHYFMLEITGVKNQF
ncbi:MAG: alkaline phosphatase [Saprospiraceae bacterium]|nr:alkaline phosphatase [Saprospiraceae bacterium]